MWMIAGKRQRSDLGIMVLLQNLYIVMYTEQIISEFGGIDVLVNNAGIFPRADLHETNEMFWEKVLGINLKGAYLMCQAAVPVMIRRGGGNIVNIGSLHAGRDEENTMAYAVSKGGVVTLTRNLAFALTSIRSE